ncbi:methyltransferase domain-containing protein [Microlunatus elymi]|uniref:Methyltransferase domain-containing protein n=1 Tax=Microlunatus elymi TaxID=2596828 RepID=A0A516Q3L0_9ACTN|nr:methyltransferase domain-containing protein [Microlunatus elymi]QDP98016.1 methyltransferase domain-containing protein [Microlunatus elymi]
MGESTTINLDRELKNRHRAMWALGDYPRIADEMVAPLGPILVRACEIGPGQRVLDVAAGTGNTAIAAARAGADVVASDLTPELLAAGRNRAPAGLKLTWEQADAEDLPYPDDEFDVVTSSIGVMFAPHHQRAADELVRVCKPGGTIGLVAWTPDGFVGQMFSCVRPFVPSPPPGVQPAPLWGNQDHLRELFGDRVTELTVRTEMLNVDTFTGPEHFRSYFASNYGPTIVAYRANAGDPERTAGLDRALIELAERSVNPDGTMDCEYLLYTARKA